MESQMEKLKLKADKEYEDEDEDGEWARGDEPRNWLELPQELTASILLRLGSIVILSTLQKVCKTWYDICKDRSIWKSIDMRNSGKLDAMPYDLEVMCRDAVDRSRDGLEDIYVEYFATDELLMYIADRLVICYNFAEEFSSYHFSSNEIDGTVNLLYSFLYKCFSRVVPWTFDRAPGLKRLRVRMCYHRITSDGLAHMVAKLPLLEEVDLTIVQVHAVGLRAVGRCCPHLKSLKRNRRGSKLHQPPEKADEDALAIAETMPELRHLMLFGNQLTDKGLHAILDHCLHLESLDLRQCFNINLSGMSAKLEKLRTERIKDLKLPSDISVDYVFDMKNFFWDCYGQVYEDPYADEDYYLEYYEYGDP